MTNRHIYYHIIISPPFEARDIALSEDNQSLLSSIFKKSCKRFAFAYEHGTQGCTLTHIDCYCEFLKKQAKQDIKKKLIKFSKGVPHESELYDLFITIKPIKTPDPTLMLGYTFKESPLRFELYEITRDEIDNSIELYDKKVQIKEAQNLFKVVKTVGGTLRLLAVEMTNEAFVESTLGMTGLQILKQIYYNLIKRGYVFELRDSQKHLVAYSFLCQFEKHTHEFIWKLANTYTEHIGDSYEWN